MFIVALLTIANTLKKPVCPPIDEWIKDVQYIYTVKQYLVIKNEIIPFAATWIDPEIIILSKLSQSKRNVI